MEEDISKTAKKRAIVSAVKSASAALGNTPAVCRNSYIHSAILETADAGILPSIMRHLDSGYKRRTGLTKKEATLVAFLTHIETEFSKPATRVKAPAEIAA